MSMDVFINGSKSWSTRSGIFECIVEETRSLFKENEQSCVREIYEPLDSYQQFIDLGNIDEGCFNLFYKYCTQAMDEFPDSERGKVPDKEYMPVILGNWSHLLENLRKDPRYRGQSIQAGSARQIAILEKIRNEIQAGNVVDIPRFREICSDYIKDPRYVGGYFSTRNAGATLEMFRDNGGSVEITQDGDSVIEQYRNDYGRYWVMRIDASLKDSTISDTSDIQI